MLTNLSLVLVTHLSVSINSKFSFVLGDYTDKKVTMIQKKINSRPSQKLNFETPKKEFYKRIL